VHVMWQLLACFGFLLGIKVACRALRMNSGFGVDQSSLAVSFAGKVEVNQLIVCSPSRCGRWYSSRSSSLLSGRLKSVSSNSARNCPLSGGLTFSASRVPLGYVPVVVLWCSYLFK